MREINECAASLGDQYPLRFGFSAILPLLDDAEVCMSEVAYSLDVLIADGVRLLIGYNG